MSSESNQVDSTVRLRVEMVDTTRSLVTASEYYCFCNAVRKGLFLSPQSPT